MSHLNRMIFVTGFARGGTSWLRTCIASHPEVEMVPREMPIFREVQDDRAALVRAVDSAIAAAELTGPWFVNKAPANAPYVGKVARIAPEAKFVFIIRDPRDVLISHKRGNQEWMKGRNSTVEGCMTKIGQYFDGYREAADLPNVHLVRYEDLHQDFHATMTRVYEFIGLAVDRPILDRVYEECSFWKIASRHQEDRDSPNRKGVVGDWVNFLEPKETRWYVRNARWSAFMRQYRYDWHRLTYGSVLTAMRDAGVASLDEDAMLAGRLDPARPNLLLLHDIDLLRTPASRQQVLDLAELEGSLGLASVFNFLPLDDPRYQPLTPAEVVAFIGEVRRRAPKAAIGLHLNATERFFPADAPAADATHASIPEAIAYLHRQIDDYASHGITFRFGTAHGYGRGAREPNNASAIFRRELATRSIRLFDEDVRLELQARAPAECRLHDVGGALTAKRFPNDGRLDDPASYRAIAPGTLINFLIHPGNYDIAKPLALGIRTNVPDRVSIPWTVRDELPLFGVRHWLASRGLWFRERRTRASSR